VDHSGGKSDVQTSVDKSEQESGVNLRWVIWRRGGGGQKFGPVRISQSKYQVLTVFLARS
jgi:hypothetical protein